MIVRVGADASVSEPAVQIKATSNEMRRFFISNSFEIKVKISSIVDGAREQDGCDLAASIPHAFYGQTLLTV